MRISKETFLQKYDEISGTDNNSSKNRRKNKSLFKNYQIGNAGTVNVNLNDGSFIHEKQLCSIKDNALKLDLNLIFNSNYYNTIGIDRTDKHMGWWKTNFHQRIFKSQEFNKETNSLDTIYIDGKGIEHVFKEKWYYEKDNIKYFIKKEDIYIDNDQKMKCIFNDYEVHYEVETTTSDLKFYDFESMYNFKRKYNPTKQKRYYIKLKDEYKKYIFVDEHNIAHVPNYFSSSVLSTNSTGDVEMKELVKYEDVGIDMIQQKPYEELIFCVEDIDIHLNDYNIDERGQISFKRPHPNEFNTSTINDTIYVEETCLPIQEHDDFFDFSDENISNLSNQIKDVESQILYLNDEITNCKKQILNFSTNKTYQKEVNALQKIIRSLTQLETDDDDDTIDDYYGNKIEPQSTNWYKYDLNTKKFDAFKYYSSITTLNSQRDEYVEQYYKLVDTLNEKTDLLKKLKETKKMLIEKQSNQVMSILIDKNNNLLGFDSRGRLIVIQDKYENTISIEYDSKNEKIVNISSASQTISFEYNKETDLLERIITPEGKLIIFSYKDNYLSSLEFKGETIQFYFNDTLHKLDITDSLKNRLIIQFEEKVENVLFEKSNIIVNSSGSLSSTGETNVLLSHNYVYNTKSTIIKDLNKNPLPDEVYEFNDEDELIYHKSTDGNILLKNYNDNDNLEYEYNCKPLTNVVTTSMKTYTVGDGTSFDINRTSLRGTKNLGLFLKRNNPNAECTFIIILFVKMGSEEKGFNKTFDSTKSQNLLFTFPIPSANIDEISIQVVTIGSEEKTEKQIVKLEGFAYKYDEDGNLILKDDGKNKIEYSNYVNDLPTLVTICDEFNRSNQTTYSYDSNGNLTFTKNHLGMCTRYFYNEKNDIIEIREYPFNEPTICNVEKIEYDEHGNAKVISENGVTETYLPNTSLISKEKGPSGQRMLYGYDFETDETKEISCSVNGVPNKVQYKYHHGLLTTLSNDNMKYEYTYDSLGRVLSIKIAGSDKNLYTFSYEDNIDYEDKNHAYSVEVTDANDVTTRSVYDEDGNLLEQTLSDNKLFYIYDTEGQLNKIEDSYGNNILTNMYNENNDLSACFAENIIKEFYFDSYNRRNKEIITLFDKEIVTVVNQYAYISSYVDVLSSVLIDSKVKVSNSYNAGFQLTQENISLSNNVLLSNDYHYLQQDENSTNLIKEQIININDEYKDTISVEYDLNGNIISEISDDNKVYYHYDELNRLIREDNLALDTTTIYQYDTRGNLLSKKQQNFTLEEKLYKIETKQRFTYNSKGWKDQLISVDGKASEYDDMGRPNNYKGNTLEWDKDGRLKHIGNNKYIYNDLGIRTGKVTDFGDYTFILDNNKVSLMNINDKEKFIFRYFVDKLIGFNYNGDEYFYQRDILGNITHILNSKGEVVAKYIYDAWGNHKVFNGLGKEDNDLTSLGNMNPFRYKGYFYDVETQLYWVSSRYYNPEWGRWLTPDSIDYLEPTSINGLNLYAYCGNNPVMYADPSGHSAILIGLIIGAIIGATVGGILAYNIAKDNGAIGWELFGWTMLGIFGGGLVGGAIGAGIGAFAGMSFSATIPTGFAFAETSIGTTTLVVTGTTTLTVTGAQILSVAGFLGATYMFSKSRPGMTNRPPFSWVTQEEGIEAMRNNNGNANSAAKEIMDNHQTGWSKGAGQDYNVIKKWLDRVIRKLLGM